MFVSVLFVFQFALNLSLQFKFPINILQQNSYFQNPSFAGGVSPEGREKSAAPKAPRKNLVFAHQNISEIDDHRKRK